MPSHFSLEAVLHFRRAVEHQQELRLRAANQQVLRVRHLIERLDTQIHHAQALRSRELSAGIRAAELRFQWNRAETLARHRCELEGALQQWQRLRDEQQQLFHQEQRRRQTLESLRDRWLRECKREAARQEQRSLDDLFLLRRALLRRGQDPAGHSPCRDLDPSNSFTQFRLGQFL